MSFIHINHFAHRAECFGILNTGKTPILRMLVGDEQIKRGDAFVQGFSLKTQMSNVNKAIGFCPQFDALPGELTALQALEIFALIRGVHRKDITALSGFLASVLNIEKKLNTQIGKVSIESRKKIAIAVALIGKPLVLLLGSIQISFYCFDHLTTVSSSFYNTLIKSIR